MKNCAIVALVSLLSGIVLVGPSSAQERGVTLKLDYPLPFGDTYYNRYDGRFGLGVGYEHPVRGGFSLRPAVEYESADRDSTIDAHHFTVRLAVGRLLQLSSKIFLIPEVGLGYSREERRLPENASPLRDGVREGFSTWFAVNPRIMLSQGVGVGASIGYKAIFLEYVENIGHSGYNRQAHSLIVGTTVSLHF